MNNKMNFLNFRKSGLIGRLSCKNRCKVYWPVHVKIQGDTQGSILTMNFAFSHIVAATIQRCI